MFRFAHPNFLWLLIPALALVILFHYVRVIRNRNIKAWGNLNVIQHLMPNVSNARPVVKFYLQLLALILIVVVLAQPQFGEKEETVKKNGIEVMIALDISNSMLAQDIQPNRLDNAKQILSQLIDNMDNDKVGMIVFAGDAFVQLPITGDYAAAKMFLSSINTQMIARQGTAIGSALDLAIRSFGKKNNNAGRAIIVLTDGENHEDDAIAAANLAVKNGINVFVVGMGKPEGAPIPVGNSSVSFKRDKDGNVVVTKLNEEVAAQIATAGKGVYVRADNSGSAIKVLKQELGKLTTDSYEDKVYTQYNEQFQSFAIFALILMILEFFIFARKNKWMKRIRLFDVKTETK